MKIILKKRKSIMKTINKKRKKIINNAEKNADRLKEYDRVRHQVRDQIKMHCPNCNCEIVKRKLNSHLQTQRCESFVKPNENEE